MTVRPGRILLLLTLLSWLLPSPAWAETSHGNNENISRFEYEITRNGRKLGTQHVILTHNGDLTTAEIDIEMIYKFGFLTLYRYTHQSHEVWRGNQLVSLRSQTDDNGEYTEAKADIQGNRLYIGGVNDPPTAADAFPTTYWNAAIRGHSQLFNTEDGELIAVRAEDVGSGELTLGNHTFDARHTRLTGDLNIDLWYTAEGVWLRSRFDFDGAEIVFELARWGA